MLAAEQEIRQKKEAVGRRLSFTLLESVSLVGCGIVCEFQPPGLNESSADQS